MATFLPNNLGYKKKFNVGKSIQIHIIDLKTNQSE